MDGSYLTSFDGAKIYYHKTTGSKNKWMIFLHGFGGDLTAWQKERAYFARENISTIAMDLRGHGLSERSSNKDFYKIENFSKDLHSLMEKEKIKNPVILGHCFGGMIAIYFHAKYPKASRGLILIDTSFKPPFLSFNPVEQVFLRSLFKLLKLLPDIKVKGHRNFNEFVGTKDWDLKRILSDILHTSLRSYLTICEDLVGLNAKQLLKQIKVPTLVIEGTSDTIFPPGIANYLNRRIKKSHLDLIPGANHIIVLNNPKDLEKSITDFLQKINF